MWLDLPPGSGVVGPLDRGFAAPVATRRWAWGCAIAVGVLSVATVASMRGAPVHVGTATRAVAVMSALIVVGLGVAVRRARMWIDAGGVRWGWRTVWVRMERERLLRIDAYADGLALVATRGSRWFVAARDWAEFAGLRARCERVGLPTVAVAGRAPWRARLQSYGRTLDGLLLAAVGLALWAALAG